MSQKKREQGKNQVKEPSTFYGPRNEKTIHFFSSHEDMANDKIKRMASRSPEQRIRNVTQMLKVFYKEKLTHHPQDLSIKFK